MYENNKLNLRLDWTELRSNIAQYGLRNSLTTALMPTASTSQILGNNECFEPFTSNLYSRMTLAGNFIIFNKHLQKDLINLGLWDDNMKNRLMASYGSVQNFDDVPQNIKNIYKTVWEIKQKAIIDHAISRSPFVDQSQSMNLFFAEPDPVKLTSALMYGWKAGLKTGMYYLRSQPSTNAQQITVEPIDNKKEKIIVKNGRKIICTEDVCTVCSS
jgi:ribonucleoside-diphosphate reductase alpha chain